MASKRGGGGQKLENRMMNTPNARRFIRTVRAMGRKKTSSILNSQEMGQSLVEGPWIFIVHCLFHVGHRPIFCHAAGSISWEQ